MYQSKQQLTIQTNALPIQDSSASVQVDQKETSVVGMQNGVNPQAEAFIYHSKRLQDDLQTLGLKIKLHEDHIKLLKSQGNKLDDSILESQGGKLSHRVYALKEGKQKDFWTSVILGKYHSSSGPKTENENHFSLQSEEETTRQILQHEKSAAGVFCKLKTRHGSQASHLQSTKDVLGIVASLGIVEDENLSRQDIDVRFAKSSGMLNKPDYYAATERQIQEMKWKKENLMDDLKRETSLWKSAKDSFERKKEELLKFLADSATYASQMQAAAQGKLTPR